MQNESSKNLLENIGLDNATCVGDTRFDRVYEIQQSVQKIDNVDDFKGGSAAFIIGSSWEEDINVLAPFINQSILKFIIAPHEISENNIRFIEKKITKKITRYSVAHRDTISDYDVLIIDNIGMLSSLYQYGDYAYIGGAFGKGLHNILEAATFGLPVFFGNKNYRKFKEATALVNRGGAFPVANYNELQRVFDTSDLQEASAKASQYVNDNIGATKKILTMYKSYIEQ